ncbi:MAG TPA: ABC transporter substrate-binding protein [Tepidiformaceae bacterium]|nr:ABC transporter substrate-binding protein [Tepidiformaceae bacterium]
MRKTWHYWSLALLAILALVVTVACGGDDDDDDGGTPSGGGTTATAPSGGEKKYDPGVTDTTITLGGSYPYSGNASAYGTIGKVIEAYFKKVNEEGGINGRKIEFKTLDDGYSPDRTVQNTRQLIEQDKVFAIFNTLGTPPNSAIYEYMNQVKVPQIYVATGASKWGADPKGHPWTIGWQPDYVSEGKAYAAYILKEKPNAKIAVIYQNDDYGKDYVKGLEEGLGDKKSAIVKSVSYEVTDATVNAQVSQLKDSGADVFYVAATPKFAIQSLTQAKQLGWAPLIIMNSVSSSTAAVMQPALQQAGPESVSDVVTTFYLKDAADPQWKDDKAMKDYMDFMKKYYPDGNVNDTFNIYGVAVAQTMVETLKRCGNTLTRENLMKQAASFKDFRVDLLLPNISINTSATDFYPIQSVQLAKFDPAGGKWNLFGEILDASKK